MTRRQDWPGTPPTDEGFRRAVRTARRRRRTTQAAAISSVLSLVAVGALVLGDRPGGDPVGLVDQPATVSDPPVFVVAPTLGPVATPSATASAAAATPAPASPRPRARASSSPGSRPAATAASGPVRPRSAVRRGGYSAGSLTDCPAAWCLEARVQSRGERYGWNLRAEACVSARTTWTYLSFAMSREVDFVVERAGRVIWRWSDGVESRPSPHRELRVRGECIHWQTVWDGVLDGSTGARGRPGDVLRVELTSDERPDTSRARVRLP